MKIEIEITDDIICGTLCAAKVNYWLKSIDAQRGELSPKVSIGTSSALWSDLYTCLLGDGYWNVWTRDEPEKVHRLDCAGIRRGLASMIKAAPTEFGRMIARKGDATTGDVFVQCCLFGEVVYG